MGLHRIYRLICGKTDFIKIKNCYSSDCLSLTKVFIFRIYKECLQANSAKRNSTIKMDKTGAGVVVQSHNPSYVRGRGRKIRGYTGPRQKA
jgi:hypothetical protein